MDEKIIFRTLSQEDLQKIVNKELGTLISRLKTNNIDLKINTNITNWIVEKAYARLYGARPVISIIQNEIESYLAKFILKSKTEDIKSIEIVLENNQPAFH